MHVGHGHFLDWLGREFQWSEWSTRRYMAVAEKFESNSLPDLPIASEALYLLAGPTVPEEARYSSRP